ncbi:PepSY domain-containing protein [Mordavella massiliensis]|uniref:PepSY domain-containing protein n=1 Tax=Mordavella massiliensis TaxID=1871024 RepID=A0A938XAS3_9CLOT|nr:PepSY domain-containing protein [Mordavella massiliensis]MBM6947622.1 PepSY domain-containing protein [Mordavella massiliensis]
MRKRSRKITAVILAAAATAGVLTGCGAAGKDIGQDEAKRIAFEDAGVSESDTSRLKVEKDRDDGMLQYEVQFSVAEKEYSYDINGSNGDILSTDVETTGNALQGGQNAGGAQDDGTAAGTGDAAGTTGNTGNTQPQTNGGAGTGTAANVAVSEADARKAALDRVPGATDADIRMELEFDDGYYIYEGDIIYEQREYEFEIDAQSGSFLKWSEERR